MRACGNGHAGSGAQRYGFLPLGLPPPHLAVPMQDVPDLIDGVVGHGPGDLAWAKFEMRHRATAELKQFPHVRAVGRDGIGRDRQLPGVVFLVHRGPGYRLANPAVAAENRAVEHLSREHLEAGLDHIRESPADRGRLILVVRRPEIGQRDLPEEAVLDPVTGLEGDNWLTRGSSSTPDRSADPDRQVTVINARLAELVAGGTERMALAGDQLYVDLDLSVDNLPAGSLLAVGEAVLRVSEAPHTGCAKFIDRFGTEAMRFVNSRTGRRMRLRGMNTRIVVPGTVRLGDLAVKADAQPVPAAQATAMTANRAIAQR
jgi:hypothetical protein